VLVAAVLAPAVGCSWLREHTGTTDQTKKGTGKLEARPAADFVAYLDERAARLPAIEYGDTNLTVYENGRRAVPVALRGSLTAAQPRNFRMVNQPFTGSGKVDLGSNDEQFWIYLNDPTAPKPVYGFATHADFQANRVKLPMGVQFDPDWVMQALGMVRFPAPRPGGQPDQQYDVRIDEREHVYVLNWPAVTPSGLAVVKEVVFTGDRANDPTPQVRRHVIRDAKTKKEIVSAEIKSAKTTTVTDPRTGQPAAVQYPTHVVLKWAEPKFEMDLTLRQAQVNPQLTDEQARRLFTRPDRTYNQSPVDLAKYEIK